MSYLEFQKQEVTNLSVSLKQEFIRTNRLGAYACSTIIYCNTRKYHGLLISPIKELNNELFVLLSSLDETVIQHNTPFHLAIHKYINDYNPLGHKYIESYKNEPTPTLTYRVGGVLLQKEILLVEEEDRILIKYTLLRANSKTTLLLRPFLAFRNIHERTHANMEAKTKYTSIENGISTQLYQGFPHLAMQISKKNEYISAPDWYNNFEYTKEKERGFACVEDLLTPGYFEFPIATGESVIFSAGLTPIKTNSLQKLFDSEIKKINPIANFENFLRNASQQFLSRKNNKTEIIASFPWPGKWGRDSMVALPGLTLALGDVQTCQDVLDTITEEIHGYMYKNVGNIEHSNVESIDTALWYVRAVQHFAKHSSITNVKKRYAKKIQEIITAFKSNQSDIITMHENGLLYLNHADKALTWADAKIQGKPVVPRWGYVVEINALWYNAIKFALEIIPNKKFQEEWLPIPENIENSFTEIFWDDSLNYLADYVTETHKDFSVRPSQVFAASLPHSPLKDEMQKHAILEIIKKELLTPRGIRTLSPKNPLYKGECKGTIQERDIAYHQGSVLLWLLAPYAEAYLELHGKSGVTEIKRIYNGLEEALFTHGIGTFSELYDGNPPHEGRGAISQAWSVAAALRIKKLIDNFEHIELTKEKK